MRIKLPNTIAQVFSNYETSEALFSELMPTLSKFLDCDRCFLYLRDPETSCGRVEFCWVRDATIPKIYNKIWKKERESLASEDPMSAAALRTLTISQNMDSMYRSVESLNTNSV
jgi:GAF domain-containing protein